jgi:hypothetical protein
MSDWSSDEENTQQPPTAQPDSAAGPVLLPFSLPPIMPLPTPLAFDNPPLIHTTDNLDPFPSAPRTSTKWTKHHAIFTKEMLTALPELLWLPGDFYPLQWNEHDAPYLAQFSQSATKFGVVSLMIYAETLPLYQISCFTFSTPVLTLLLDLPRKLNSLIQIPRELFETLEGPDLIVVCPGEKDWHFTAQNDHLIMLRDVVVTVPNFKKLIFLQNYEVSLNIQPTVPQLCSHLRMLRWLFQIFFDAQLHGRKRQSSALTKQWRTLIDYYGKLLIFLYWGLELKQQLFDHNSTKGVNLEPIYLEQLLTDYRVVEDIEPDELRRKLIGQGRYPAPPLPRMPS